MKIAVYTIALNEAQFVERWYQSAREADHLYILDTGSTDDTVEIAKKLGIHTSIITVKPWRFDHARQASLDALPDDIDYAIALDMDEVLQPGWRQALESVPEGTTRPRYSYTWSWLPDGSPDLVYGGDKIHARHGYQWRHPVHEVLTPLGEEKQEWIKLEIHHHPDTTKSRGQYFPLLKLAIEEDPDDDRNAFYYARELYFHSMNDEAIKEFRRHLALPRAVWEPERAASMRYLAKLEPHNRERWLLRAIAEAPEQREARCELAEYYYTQKLWPQSYAAALSALAITDKSLSYLCESDAWSWLPHDQVAIAAYNMGLHRVALEHGRLAVQFAPYNERLGENLIHYEGAAQ